MMCDICVSANGVKYDSIMTYVPWVSLYFVYFVRFCDDKVILDKNDVS